jgi:hypothetical protein
VATVLFYRENDRQPRAEVALANGDRIHLALDRGGLTISHGSGGDTRPLFEAEPEVVERICAGLAGPPSATDATPLQIIVAAVMQLASAADVERAFRDAAGSLS